MPFWDLFGGSNTRSSTRGSGSNGGPAPRGPRRRSTRDSDITHDSQSDMSLQDESASDYIDRVRHTWGVHNEGQRSARAVWNNNPELETKEHWNRLDRLRRGATDYATQNRVSYGDAWRRLNDRAAQVEGSYIQEHRRRQEEQRQRERERFQNRRGLTSILFGGASNSNRGRNDDRSRSPARPVRRSTTRARSGSPLARRHPGSPSRRHPGSPSRRSRPQTPSRTTINRRSTRW